MLNKLKQILGKTDDIILRYPMVMVMAFIGAISAVVGITLDNEPNQFLVTKLALTACLGISIMFGIKMLSQRIGRGFLMEIIGSLFLIFFYFYLPETEKEFTVVYAFVLIPIFILSHLFVSFSAFLNQKPELNFWQFNKNLFINIVLTAIFTGVLVGGVGLAILAVEKLFDFNFDYRIYPKTLLFLAILGSCFIFLLFNDNGLEKLEEDGTYPEILKFFTQFILIPLLMIYSVIFYFYVGKIVINWELPKGWISYLVLAYSVVGILALLLVYPLKEQKSWVKIFSKIFYYTLIPLLVLLFVAIFTRILEYGYTEPRYYVLIIAIWLTSVVLYFIFFKKASIKFIPISLFAFGTFALLFPYFNAFSVAKRSQKNELTNILNENKLLQNGKINFTKKVSSEVAEEVANKFGFLSIRKENDFINSFLDQNTIAKLKVNESNNHDYFVLNTIRSSFSNVINEPNNSEMYRLELIADQNFKTISGYQYISRIRNSYDGNLKINGDEIRIVNKTNVQEKIFKITLNSSETVDLMPTLRKILDQNKTGQINVPEISAETDLGKYHIKILFDNLVREKFPNNQENIYFSDALVLVKEK